MSDIVNRLRGYGLTLCDQAADRIEKLENECMRLENLRDIDTCRKAVLDDIRGWADNKCLEHLKKPLYYLYAAFHSLLVEYEKDCNE